MESHTRIVAYLFWYVPYDNSFTLVLAHVLLDVTVRYEKELYSVDEEAGSVTLALVLEGEASVPVTVSVRTLDLQNSSYGDAATGELMQFASS